MKNFVMDLINEISPVMNTRLSTIIDNIKAKINCFDNAINVCNDFQDSEHFFDLTKKSMKVFSERKKAIKSKIEKLIEVLTNLQQYAIVQANTNEILTASADMYTVDYYRKLGEEYGYTTQELEVVKKFFSGLFLTTAKLEVMKKPLEKFPKRLLYCIAFATLHHNFHQQNCNEGQWLPGLKVGTMKQVADTMGYKSSYNKE